MIQFAPEPGGREALDAFLRSLLVAGDWTPVRDLHEDQFHVRV